MTSTISSHFISDEEPPVFHETLDDIHKEIPCTQDASTVITWRVPSVTDNSGDFTLSTNFKPGDNFDLGKTTVVYRATDPSGNSANMTFTVSVTGK